MFNYHFGKSKSVPMTTDQKIQLLAQGNATDIRFVILTIKDEMR